MRDLRITQLLPIGEIRPASDNVREKVGDVTDLLNSIREVGLLNPLVVAEQGDHYIIVAGHRRITALRKLGWTEIPCMIRPAMNDSDRTALMMVENSQRVDLDPIEKARAYKRMNDQGRSQVAIAKSVGVSPVTINHHIALLELPDDLQQRIRRREVSIATGLRWARRLRQAERTEKGHGSPGYRKRPGVESEWIECEVCWGRGKVRKGPVTIEQGRYRGVPGCINCTPNRRCFKHQREQAEADQQELSRLRVELERKKQRAPA